MATQSPVMRLKALKNIISMESSNGFPNRAVSGGLDLFLRSMKKEKAHPAVRLLIEKGMLDIEYAELDRSNRERWAEEVVRILAPYVQVLQKPLKSRASQKTNVKRREIIVSIDSPITDLRSVTRNNASRLNRIGVEIVRDLLFLFPRRHLDYSKRVTISQAYIGEEQTFVVSLWSVREIQLGKKLKATEATVGDETGNLKVVWFGQPWLAVSLKRGLESAERNASGDVRLVLSGRITKFNKQIQMDSPEWEILEDPDTSESVHTGRLVPVYPSTEGLPQRTIRRIVREALDITIGFERNSISSLIDPLSESIKYENNFMSLPEAVLTFHYPETLELKELARRRLTFDEFFTLQLALMSRRKTGIKEVSGVALNPQKSVLAIFIDSLPFKLTNGQKVALDETLADIESGKTPMSRLLQGDVGSGKTVVALACLLSVVANGYQGALMAPTEVLAEQHFMSVARLLSGVGHVLSGDNWFSVNFDLLGKPLSVGLLTGSTKAKARKDLVARSQKGDIDILIGTHALIQDDVELPNLAFAVVDEQHRFGVNQRAALRAKGIQPNIEPHLLVMTATPIPRSLRLTSLGDLKVSTIDELPSGRASIQTHLVPPDRREDAESFVVSEILKGRQAFIICPLIDESETILARAATEEFERLKNGPFASASVGLLHGRMSISSKQEVMEAFRAKQIDILVATTVIEVGIDIPNASVILIEAAERFGLSQLHQLRGRVGRGTHSSYCLLLPESLGNDARNRLEVIVRSSDGFEIAEADLNQRGSGDVFGTKQAGLPTLRIGKVSDIDILGIAKNEAEALLLDDPELSNHPILASQMNRFLTQVVDEVG